MMRNLCVLLALACGACRGNGERAPDDARSAAAAAPVAADSAPAAASAATAASALSAPLERERALAELVDAARAQQRVRELVTLGPRMGGTRSGRDAARYRMVAFTEAGLDVRLVVDEEKWAHTESRWSLAWSTAGAQRPVQPPAQPLASAWPYGFSPRSSGSACLVAVERDAHPPPACGALPAAWLCANTPRMRAGGPAPALVLVDGHTTLDGSHPVVGDLQQREQARVPVFGLSRADGAALRVALAAGTHVHVEFELDAEIARERPATIIASLPARAGAPPGYLLFCAHGDSDAGGPGADDNASGEAVLLEIASAWAAGIARGIVPAPAREVRFAIWGSEIHSTRGFLKQCASAAELPLAVINYDQAGFGSGADQLHIEPDDLPANRALIEVITAVLADHQGTEGFPARWLTNKSLGGTDSYVFSDSERFVADARPALTLYSSAWGKPAEHPRTSGMRGESWRERDTVAIDYDNYYHSAGDTPENTTDREPWNMAWCARVGMLSAMRWLERLDDPQRAR